MIMTRKNLLLAALALGLALPASAAPATSGTIKAAGTLTVQKDCRILTDANGHKFALLGKLDKLANGDQIEVTGKDAKRTKCLDGPAIQVEKVEKLKARQGQAPSGTPAIEIVTDTGQPGGQPPADGPKKGQQVRMFHMTGTLIPDGKNCQAFRNLRGMVFTLVGDLKGFKTGDKVTLEGVGVDNPSCRPGPTVQINSIQPAER